MNGHQKEHANDDNIDKEQQTLQNEDDDLLFFNYHEIMIQDYEPVNSHIKDKADDDNREAPQSLVTTHFPNPYDRSSKITRIVRIPRDYSNTIDDSIPIFSTVLPGYEKAAILEPNKTTGTENNVALKGVIPELRSFQIKGKQTFPADHLPQYYGISSVSPLSLYLSPEEFTTIVTKINKSLQEIYSESNPYTTIWNLLDLVLLSLPSMFGLNKFIPHLDKSSYHQLENYIEQLNDKQTGLCGSRNIRLISPRRSGFLSLDFEVPTPTAKTTTTTTAGTSSTAIHSSSSPSLSNTHAHKTTDIERT